MSLKHRLVLKLPPSVNHCYGNRRGGGRFLKPEAVAWKDESALRLKMCRIKPYESTDKVVVEVLVTWPDNRRRDCDNLAKLTQDAIQQSGIVEDDRYLLWRVMDWKVNPALAGLEITLYKKD